MKPSFSINKSLAKEIMYNLFVYNGKEIDGSVFDLTYIFNNKPHYESSTECTTKRVALKVSTRPNPSDSSAELLSQWNQVNDITTVIRDALVDEISRWFGSFSEFDNRIVIRKVSIMARLPSCEHQCYHMDGTKDKHFFAVWPLGINVEEGK